MFARVMRLYHDVYNGELRRGGIIVLTAGTSRREREVELT